MHLLTIAALVATFAHEALTSPIAHSPYVVKETHFVPKDWQMLERAHGGKTIQLQIGLKQGRFDELDRHLHEGKLPPATQPKSRYVHLDPFRNSMLLNQIYTHPNPSGSL